MGSDKKSRHLRDAEKYVANGKIPQAIAEYQKILLADPNDILILNTVGDLYLKLGKLDDAKRLFFQVAEHYSNNKFHLKAIAVYKKILAADPSNLDINAQIAVLYARQGMNVDARIQYMSLAELYSRGGKAREVVEAYEKVIELDPKNADVRLKLAEVYLEQGDRGKARFCFAGAAKAQAKAGDIKGASASFERALRLAPRDLECLKGFLEVALELGETAHALAVVKPHIDEIQDDAGLTELLGRSHLAAGDAEGAMVHLERIFAVDGSGSDHIMEAARIFMHSGQIDRAAECLERVTSVFISRREPGRALAGINHILESHPVHIPALRLQAKVFSAMNEEGPYLDTLDRLVTACRAEGQSGAALETLEKILEYRSESREHLAQHQALFAEVHPDRAYVSPDVSRRSRQRDAEIGQGGFDSSDGKGANPVFVEIDLLFNYGMHDKANQMLRDLVARDPWNREARLRLAAEFRRQGSTAEAAEQLLLVAALSIQAGNELEADRRLAEAQEIAPNLASSRDDLAAFARKHGITISQQPSLTDKTAARAVSPGEIDFSVDLTEVFFSDSVEPDGFGEEEDEAPSFEVRDEALVAAASRAQGPDSLAEQLQEVDFYIRLGFIDEARIKLDEIARLHPESPELAARYYQLDAGGAAAAEPMMPPARGELDAPRSLREPAAALHPLKPAEPDHHFGNAPEIEMDLSELERAEPVATAAITLSGEDGTPEPMHPAAAAEAKPVGAGADGVNVMFADLIDEVNALTNQGIAQEDYDTHYSLGVAYREMDLLEDAIKEFQTAMKALDAARSPREVVQCSGMLSTCFLEKGMPRSAIRWCQTGLKIPEISPHERLALQYDMGVAHAMAGEADHALECLGGVFRADPSYRDVAQRIDELKGGTKRNGPWDPAKAPETQHRRQK